METPLPDVFEGLLDSAGLDALFCDLGSLRGPVEISVKHAVGRVAEQASTLNLASAREALLTAGVRAVQLRYVHEGKAWCDTLLNTPQGVRIVRMAG